MEVAASLRRVVITRRQKQKHVQPLSTRDLGGIVGMFSVMTLLSMTILPFAGLCLPPVVDAEWALILRDQSVLQTKQRNMTRESSIIYLKVNNLDRPATLCNASCGATACSLSQRFHVDAHVPQRGCLNNISNIQCCVGAGRGSTSCGSTGGGTSGGAGSRSGCMGPSTAAGKRQNRNSGDERYEVLVCTEPTCHAQCQGIRGFQAHRRGTCPAPGWITAGEHEENQCQVKAAKFFATQPSQTFCETERERLDNEFASLMYTDLMPQTSVDKVRGVMSRHIAGMQGEVNRRLAASSVNNLQEVVASVFDVHRGQETAGQLRARFEPAPAVRRDLIDDRGGRVGDHVYDVPISEGIRAILRDNPSVLSQLQEAAASWANPKKGESKTVFVDISDGSILQEHPELGVSADRSDGAVRLGFILYYDDVEVVNALGAFTGVHKLGLFYWALLNLDPSERMVLSNIHLATVALQSDIAYYGVEQIVSGPPSEPDWHLEGAWGTERGSSIGASLRALHTGMTLPVSVDGAHVPTLFRGWLVVVSADYPAAGLLIGAMQSVSANLFCRECKVDRRKKEDYNKVAPPRCT